MALEFDGAQNQEVVIPDTPDLSFTDMTISFWAKGGSIDDFVLYKGSSSEDREYSITSKGSGKYACRVFKCNDSNTHNTVESTTEYPLTKWLHVFVTWSDSAHIVKIYVENSLEDSDNTNDFSMCDDTSDLYIGDYGGGGYDFTGQIFDLRFYNRVLSVAERTAIYYARGNDNIVNGLKARWLMNEKPDGQAASGANSVIDISGNGNHGTPVNSPIYRGAPMRLVKPIIIGG